MRQSRVTNRYAKALLQLSIDKVVLEQSYDDMVLITMVCKQNKDLALLLKTPIVKTDLKLKILNEIFSNKLGALAMMFVRTITSKKREDLLASIAQSFIDLYKKHNNIESATVTTAFPLNNTFKEKVVKYIKNHDDKQVELTEVVDKNIIGGAIIRIGDKQLDSSVASEISKLRKTFNKNLYLQDF
jgi:F-type H+-transporting ATPase subunit delta